MVKLRFISHAQEVIRALDEKERKVLFWTGSWTKRRMEWVLSKPRPAKRTKTGKITKRYQREVVGGAERPPYRVTGYLRNNVRFAVDTIKKQAIAGPVLLRKPSQETRPGGAIATIPALLDQGGTATVPEREVMWKTSAAGTRYSAWTRTGRRISTSYRRFPYVEKTRNDAWQKLKERLQKERL